MVTALVGSEFSAILDVITVVAIACQTVVCHNYWKEFSLSFEAFRKGV